MTLFDIHISTHTT